MSGSLVTLDGLHFIDKMVVLIIDISLVVTFEEDPVYIFQRIYTFDQNTV